MACRTVLDEIAQVLARVATEEVLALEDAILSAGAVFVVGAGRSGLVGRAFAMRLSHLGLPSHVVGETVTPPVAPGDIVVALSASGETATTCATAESAVTAGARVAAITACSDCRLARSANLAVVIPADTKAAGVCSVQYGGSLFEQALMVLLDTVACRLQARLSQTTANMNARHANLE